MAFKRVENCINIKDDLVQWPTVNSIENSLQINAFLFQWVRLSVLSEHLPIEWGVSVLGWLNWLAKGCLRNPVSFLVLHRNRSLLQLEVFWILNLHRLSHNLMLEIKQFFLKLLSAHQGLVIPPLLLQSAHLLSQLFFWLQCYVFLDLLRVLFCQHIQRLREKFVTRAACINVSPLFLLITSCR